MRGSRILQVLKYEDQVRELSSFIRFFIFPLSFHFFFFFFFFFQNFNLMLSVINPGFWLLLAQE